LENSVAVQNKVPKNVGVGFMWSFMRS